ncbi:MAG: hypothetical protein RLZZ258_972 [Actinomycetota bacterium]
MTKRLALWAAPLLFVAVLFYLPLGRILGLGLSSEWLQIFLQSETADAIWFTVWQAALSTLICLLLGIPGAYILYRRRFFGQRFIRALITVPLVLPTIIVAIAFSNFRDLPAIPVIIAAHVFVNYSITVRTIGGVWATMDNETEEAAELAGAGRFRTLISISLPQLKPAVVSAAALTFLFCSTSYGIILVIGGGLVHSVETEIALSAVQLLDLPKASALALFQTLLTVVAFTISENIVKTSIGIEQVDEGSPKPSIDRRDWAAVAFTVMPLLILIVSPLVLVLSKAFMFDGAFSIQNFVNLSTRGDRQLLNISVAQATLNTLRNVVISTGLAVGLGTLAAWLLSRPSKTRVQHLIQTCMDVLFLLPMGISSVVLGFGYLISFGSGPIPLRESWLVIPLVQALMALPLVIRLVYPALLSIGNDHREAASTAGANASQTWWHIESRMIRNVILTAIGYALIVSIGEFGAASLLAYGDQATLPTVLFALISRPGQTNYGMAMAVSACLILLTLAMVFAVSLRKRPSLHQQVQKARQLFSSAR